MAGRDRVPAFPGAEGAGAFTPGGRGGRVILVTNLNDSGPGSLRAACDAKDPRIVVFRVSGIIELKSDLTLRNPFITIAGQSAPGAGICLKDGPLEIKTHDVIVRHLRCRPGDVRKKEFDSLSASDARNIIVDHCSASWGIDETLSVTRDSDNVTVQWCMITESLTKSVHHKGAHGYGSLVTGYDGRYSFHHNIYAHHSSRNPRPGGEEGRPGIILDFRNNLIYDWGFRAGYSGETRVRINYVGNYLKPGPSTKSGARGFAFKAGSAKTGLFVSGNFLAGFPKKNRDQWLMVQPPDEFKGDLARLPRFTRPFDFAPVHTDTAEAAYWKTLKYAGAILPVRDPVDARIVREIKTGSGRLIDSQQDVGGWPEYAAAPAPPDSDSDGMPDSWEIKYRLNPADPSDNSRDPDSDGYTNIEEYLNSTDPLAPYEVAVRAVGGTCK